jgi:hypothetical protein
MKINRNLAKKNKVEKLKISENQTAWLLPKSDNFRKMIAYSYNNSITWVHPEYRDGKNSKK